MPQIREQIAMVHLPPSKTLKYLFHVRKTSVAVYLDAAQKSLEKSRLFAFFTPIFQVAIS